MWNFFEPRSQNGPISVKWKHQSQFIFCMLIFSHKHITFDILKNTLYFSTTSSLLQDYFKYSIKPFQESFKIASRQSNISSSNFSQLNFFNLLNLALLSSSLYLVYCHNPNPYIKSLKSQWYIWLPHYHTSATVWYEMIFE